MNKYNNIVLDTGSPSPDKVYNGNRLEKNTPPEEDQEIT